MLYTELFLSEFSRDLDFRGSVSRFPSPRLFILLKSFLMLVPMQWNFNCLSFLQEALSYLLPFLLLLIPPTSPPTSAPSKKLLVNNTDYEVCTDQEVCHGHSYFCLLMLLLKLDKMQPQVEIASSQHVFQKLFAIHLNKKNVEK